MKLLAVDGNDITFYNLGKYIYLDFYYAGNASVIAYNDSYNK